MIFLVYNVGAIKWKEHLGWLVLILLVCILLHIIKHNLISVYPDF